MDIAVKHVYKSFGERILFENLCLAFPAGHITCVTGPSGCGKTTIFNLLMGLENADSGIIEHIDNLRISAVFQEDRLCENISALSNAAIALGRNKTRSDAKVMLSSLGLADALNQPAYTLSGGMKRRVALARALLADYDLLLLDEPFTGLDEESRAKAISCIKANLNGRTAIIITHDADISGSFAGDSLYLPDILKKHNC